MATQSDREIELSQTNRGVGGVCVGVVSRVQSKLSRALHAHRGKKLLQDLQTQESGATKRAMVRFRGAREKGGECCTLRYRIDITRANQKPLLHITRTNHLAHLAVFDIVINLRRP